MLCWFCLVLVFVLYMFRVCLYVGVVLCLGLFWFRVWLVVGFVVVLFVGAAFVLWFGLACVRFCVVCIVLCFGFVVFVFVLS